MSLLKIIIVLIVFIPLLLACFRYHKWYLYLFFAFYGILPDTFAIEIAKSLPLLTGTRVLIFILIMVWLAKTKGKTRIDRSMRPFITYIAISCTVCVINMIADLGEINKLFILIIQRLFPVLIVRDLIESNKEFDSCIDFLLLSSAVVALIGILQTGAHIDVSEVFQLVKERANSSLSDRMGLMRAKGLFNAIQYGSFCSFITILALFKFIEKRKKKYLIITSINIIALFLTMSRSSIIPLIIIMLPMVYKKRKRLIRPIVCILPCIIIICSILFLYKPGVFDVIGNVWNSILRTLGFSVDVSKAFGDNVDGSISRLMQFSLIPYMFLHGGWLFGLGYNALVKGLYHFYFPMYHSWSVAHFIDIGFVDEFGSSGLIGLFALLYYISSLYKLVRVNRGNSNYFFVMEYVIILYVFLNLLTACISMNVFWMLIMLLYAKLKLYRRINYNE